MGLALPIQQSSRDNAGATERRTRTPSSLALNNLRGVVILIVLGFHSVLAYLGSLDAASFPFDISPYKWRAFPIVDSHRWYGFDLFCAWQDVYLMALMFLLSALFAWPSLSRKKWRLFLSDRALRLGLPFLVAMFVVMPIALYPVYRMTAADPDLSAYARHYWALPFLPNGPMWFLWLLLGFSIIAAGSHRLMPGWIERQSRLLTSAESHPGRFFAGLVLVAAAAYIPLALMFTPWNWNESGPFALQLSRPLLYLVFYLAGLGVGALGLERGLLAPAGMLVRHWAVWLTAALTSLILWMGLTALTMRTQVAAPIGLQMAVDISFVAACASGCFCVMAVCLRFGVRRSRFLEGCANNAFGMYLFHYIFVVWLQYALLDLPIFAVAKAAIVFGGTLALAWATCSVTRLLPFGAQLIGAEPRRAAQTPSASGDFAIRRQA